MKVKLQGDMSPNSVKVHATREEVYQWRKKWPGCALPDGPAWVEFAIDRTAYPPSCGDLLDGWSGAHSDSHAAAALWEDMRECADKWFAEEASGPEALAQLLRLLPTGSGFNSPWGEEHATARTLVLGGHYQYMNEHGFYDGWIGVRIYVAIDRTVTVKYQWGFSSTRRLLRRDPGIKDYIEETVHEALRGWCKGPPVKHW